MEQQPSVQQAPDGGIRAWVQCAGSFFLLLNTFGLTNSYGVFQAFYGSSLLRSYPPSQIAWIGSVQTFLLISLGIVTGPAFDRGHLQSMLLTGSLLIVAGTVFTGLGSQYWHLFLSQGLMVGIGAGLLFLPSIAILAQYFKKKLALATGIASSGGGLGSVLYAIMFNCLQPRIGFRYTTWSMALVMLVTLSVSCSILRLRLHNLKARKIFDVGALNEAPFCLWSAHLFVSLLGLYAPSFYIQSYGLRFMPRETAFYLLPVLNAGSFFGRILPLYAADRLGYFNILLSSTFFASIAGFAWLAVQSEAGCFAFSACYGFLAGTITTISAPIEVNMCPSDDVVGVRVGMFLFPWALGFLIGNPISGALLGDDGEAWTRLQIFVGCVILVAALFGMAARYAKFRYQPWC